MKTNVISILCMSLMLLHHYAIGQQQDIQSQYVFNQMTINPAYTGSHGYSRVNFISKTQWSDIEGAPKTQVFTYDGPINKIKSASIGLLFINDKVGISSQTGGFFTYSYAIKTSENNKLSFGLQTGIKNFRFQESLLENVDPNDPLLTGDYNETKWNFGFGLFYERKQFYAGISIPQFLENKLDVSNKETNVKATRHYYGNFGFIIDLNRSLKLQPSMLLSYVESTTLKADINMNLLINEVMWAGLSYKSFDALGIIIKIKLSNKMWFGYNYDIIDINTNLKNTIGSTHEFMMTIGLFSNDRFVSPRYF